MFSCRISPISLHLSLFLSSFVNCYVYMIVRSSLKNNYLYEIHCIYSSLFPVWVTAQTYKYIGIEDGLSNRRIFNIQKDAQGYMWFLTNEGMDRYNGKDIKHYKLNKEGTILDAPIRLGWLYTEPHIGIWVVGKQGRVFQYEADRDDFKMVYKLPDTSEAISCGYLDRNDNIWICRKDTVLLYNT